MGKLMFNGRDYTGGCIPSNFQLTNLWNYVEDNAGVIPYRNFSTLTLNDSLTNYDGVFFEFISDIQDLSDWKGTVFTPIYMIEALEKAYFPFTFSFTSYGGRCARYALTYTTITCVQSDMNMINGLVNVWGVKFCGSGSGGKEVSKYLPETYKSDIVCEATLDNFDSTSQFWGDGPTPIRLSDPVSIQDGGVLIPVKSDSVFAYVDREITGRPFTAYIVAKLINPDQGGRIISSLYSHTSNKGILLAGNPVIVSSWANDTATDVASTNYFVGVIQYSSGVGLGKVNDETRIWKPTDKIGQEIVIGRTDINPQGSDEVPSDIIVKYFAVVDHAESMKAIEDNVASLMERFNIS